MAIGTGLFLGLAVWALVWVFVKTMDRWKWRRIILWLALVFVVLPVLGFAAWLGYEYWDSRPRPVTQYYGINLGDSKEDVLYEKGTPVDVEEDPTKDEQFRTIVEVKDIPAGKSINDYHYWVYHGERDSRDPDVTVKFSRQTQRVVSVACYTFLSPYCPSLLGAGEGTSEEWFYKTLGPPSRTTLENSVKTIEYAKFNVSYMLTKKEAYGFIVERVALADDPRTAK